MFLHSEWAYKHRQLRSRRTFPYRCTNDILIILGTSSLLYLYTVWRTLSYEFFSLDPFAPQSLL